MGRETEERLPEDQVGLGAARLQRQHQALADLEKIETRPYEEFEDFHRVALDAADLDD